METKMTQKELAKQIEDFTTKFPKVIEAYIGDTFSEEVQVDIIESAICLSLFLDGQGKRDNYKFFMNVSYNGKDLKFKSFDPEDL